MSELFESITLYDNRATEAIFTRRSDGEYVVRLQIEAKKFRADGEGAETEVPVDDWIDLAVFGAKEPGGPPEGRLLALEKRRIEANHGVFELVVSEEPVKAGIDPYDKLIDRNPENNVTKVSPGAV